MRSHSSSLLRVERRVVGAFALLCIPLGAQAQDDVGLPLWELGAIGVGVSQQAYPGASARVNRALALPYFLYRGRVLRADRSGAGLRALKTDNVELDIGVASAFGSSADDVPVRQGMPDIGMLVEIGPRLKWTLHAEPRGGRWQAEFPLRGVFDLSDDLAHRGMAFEPTLRYESSATAAWQFHTSFGAVLADRRLADVFYGVAPGYATPERPAYTARSGLIVWRAGTTLSYRVTPDLRLFGFVRVDSVGGTVNETSPLADRRTGASVGLALSYTFMRSQRPAED